MRCVMWRSGLLLTNWGQLRWINVWIIKWSRHMYWRWWQLIYLRVTFLAIKALVITRSVMIRSEWLLTNRGQLGWIDDWIIKWRRNIYHWWWKIIALWLTVLAIVSPVKMSSHSLPTLIVPCSIFMAINKQNSRHTTPPQTHIAYIIPRPKGISRCHKNGTGNNQGRQRTNPHDKQCSDCKYSHSKSNELSSPVISVSPPLNNWVINPPQLSSVGQQSSRSSQKTPHNNWWFNSNDSNSKRNELSSPVIPVPPPLNDSAINLFRLSLLRQQSSRSSHNTTHG